MRRFLTTTASATFFGESKYTARIMKDHLEYIVRNQPGMYAVVLVIPAAKDVVRVVCNWGRLFRKSGCSSMRILRRCWTASLPSARRHRNSSETVVCLLRHFVEYFYDDSGTPDRGD